jgi:hypothetical protein
VSRSASLLVVGLWLGLLVSSWAMATVNFRSAEAASTPARTPDELNRRLQPLSAEDRRHAFRYLASEINRWMFRSWGLVQAGLGLVLLALLWSAGGSPRALALAALVLVLLQAGVLGPMIAAVGREADFLARPLPPDVARRFGIAHGGYVVVDLLKMAALAAAAFVLIRRS